MLKIYVVVSDSEVCSLTSQNFTGNVIDDNERLLKIIMRNREKSKNAQRKHVQDNDVPLPNHHETPVKQPEMVDEVKNSIPPAASESSSLADSGQQHSHDSADNIHMAETVPVTVPIHGVKSAFKQCKPKAVQEPLDESSFQEIKIRYCVGESKSSEEGVNTDVSDQSCQEQVCERTRDHFYDKQSILDLMEIHNSIKNNSSTEYYSPPDHFLLESINNLKKIRENRQRTDRMLYNSRLGFPPDYNEQSTGSSGSGSFFQTPPRYYRTPIKEDGSGKRPLKKRDKFEMTKRNVIQEYLQKLIILNPNAVKNLSVSTVEGSGLTISSPSFLAPENKSSNAESSSDYSTAQENSSGSSINLDSKTIEDYCGLDRVPTKLPQDSSQKLISQLAKLKESRDSHFKDVSNSYGSDHLSASISLPSLRSKSKSLCDLEGDQGSSSMESSLSGSCIPPAVNYNCHDLDRRRMMIIDLLYKIQAKKKENIRLQQQENLKNISGYSTLPRYAMKNSHSFSAYNRKSDLEDYYRSMNSINGSASRNHVDLSRESCNEFNMNNTQSSKYDSIHLKSTNLLDFQRSKTLQHLPKQRYSDSMIKENYDHGRPTIDNEVDAVISEMSKRSMRISHSNGLNSSSIIRHSSQSAIDEMGVQAADVPRRAKNLSTRPRSYHETSKSSSSSYQSLPDLTELLDRFGITAGWAQSMVRRMDEAEGSPSSDSA